MVDYLFFCLSCKSVWIFDLSSVWHKTFCSSVAILFSIQVLSTAQGPVQQSPGMTSTQSQFICGGQEVCPTLEMYCIFFWKASFNWPTCWTNMQLSFRIFDEQASLFLSIPILFQIRHPLLFNSQSNCLNLSVEEIRYVQLLKLHF